MENSMKIVLVTSEMKLVLQMIKFYYMQWNSIFFSCTFSHKIIVCDYTVCNFITMMPV